MSTVESEQSRQLPRTSPAPTLGRPSEQLEVEEPSTAEDNIVYPTGPKLWFSVTSLMTSMLFVGLDMTIVAVAVPSLTDYFKTLNDIGWYSSAYMLFSSSFIFFWSRLYNLYAIKRLYLSSIVLFQLGSLFCTVAPKSAVFIFGRALAGFGACGLGMGNLMILTHTFPSHKRPWWTGLSAGTQSVAMVAAPLVGGALIDAFSWRACFGINLPFGVLTFALTAYGFQSPAGNEDTSLPFKEKMKRMDFLGTLFFVPGIVCLLVALQWGGTRYGWNNPKIIVFLVVFAVLTIAFGLVQYKGKELATLPPRVVKQRSILAAAWFCGCCNGILAVTEYYIAIYFQGVRGYTAVKSGALGLPLIVGLLVSSVTAGAFVTVIGYYYPLMFATTLFAPIAAGLLTTLDPDESLVKVLCLLGFLGTAVGLGLNVPVIAAQTVLPVKDVAIGLAVTGFAGGLGSSLFISASSALFQNRLKAELAGHAPGVNVTAFDRGGLANVRGIVGRDRLKAVLFGYDEAVVQTLYFPVALAVLTVFASVAIERRSVKKKQT